MKTGAELREAMHNGQIVCGTMLHCCRNPRWAEVLQELDFDYVIVDTEHTPFSRGQVADMMAMLRQCGTVPIVRVYRPDSYLVAMALDAGAEGVLVPYCETVQEVKEVLAAARYRPLKGAVVERAIAGDGFVSDEVEAYLATYNANNVVIIGIESVPAVENLARILGAGDIDAVFVGPHDMTVSMGIPEQYEHPDFLEMVRRIIRICDARSIPAGVHWWAAEQVTHWIGEGSRFVLYGSDELALLDGYRRGLDTIRGCLPDATLSEQVPPSWV
jgi:2-keto-3-deoxy-L-rhamnonate aldolase RhmA